MADVQQLLVLHSEELKRLEKRVQVKYSAKLIHLIKKKYVVS